MKHYEAATIVMLIGAALIAAVAVISDIMTGNPDSPDAEIADTIIEDLTGIS